MPGSGGIANITLPPPPDQDLLAKVVLASPDSLSSLGWTFAKGAHHPAKAASPAEAGVQLGDAL
jgi:hypothetical protein